MSPYEQTKKIIHHLPDKINFLPCNIFLVLNVYIIYFSIGNSECLIDDLSIYFLLECFIFIFSKLINNKYKIIHQ